MVDRKAVEVVRFGGFQYRVDAEGKLDPEHLGEVMALAGEVVLGGVLPTEPCPRRGRGRAPVREASVEARQPVAAGRRRDRVLHALVNRKAGSTVM